MFVNTRRPEQRYLVIQFDRNDNATDYFDCIIERYQKRPYGTHNGIDFDNMCLIEFVAKLEPFYSKQKQKKDQLM